MSVQGEPTMYSKGIVKVTHLEIKKKSCDASKILNMPINLSRFLGKQLVIFAKVNL